MTDGLNGNDGDKDAILSNPARLAALARTGLLADRIGAPADGVFDRLTSLATRLTGAPIALVSLVSDQEQILVGATGVPEENRRTPLSYSFSRFVVAAGEQLVVPDVRERADILPNPAISEYGVVAFCGIPLRVGGETVGAFCALSSKVRRWSADEVGILQDLAVLAERELEMQARRRQEALVPSQFASLLNSLPTGVYASDSQGRLMFYNAHAARLWGIEPSRGSLESDAFALRGPLWPDGSPVSADETPLHIALRTGEPVPAVEVFIGSQQDSIVALASAEPLFTSEGELVGALAVLHDVTALRKAGRLRDELLDLVSHELRTPLTVISGMASFLARRGVTADADARMEAAGQLLVASRRMERVVENMLQLSRLNNDGLEPEPVLAQMILNQALHSNTENFPLVSVSQVGDGLHAITYAVENWSVLALTNLLHNATQYGDPSESPLVEILTQGDEVHIRVSNAGPVFTDEEFNVLFDPFFRRPETRDHIPGAGLGLTTARKLAEAQGGRLLAGPRPDNGGPMFTLVLPAHALQETELP